MRELLPCPFCGGEAEISTHMDESIWSHETVPYTKVACRECEIGTEYRCQGWEPTALEEWNRRATPAPVAAPSEPRQWRCFHCDEIFTTVDAATDHFGPAIYSDPACAIDAHRLRELEAELTRHREEDTDLHRELHRKDSERQQAVQRAEEDGYARGLRDGANLPSDSSERAAVASGTPAGANAAKREELGLSDGENLCDTCQGDGTIDETLGGHSFSNPKAPCPDCDGKGWWAAGAPAVNEWREAIEGQLMLAHLGTTDTPAYSDPRQAIGALLDWHVEVARGAPAVKDEREAWIDGLPSLYFHTGDIKDVNTVLVNRADLRASMGATPTPPEDWHAKADRLKKCVDYAPTAVSALEFRNQLHQHLSAGATPAQSEDKEHAAMYRWLRNRQFASGGNEDDGDFRWASCFEEPEQLDAAISAAMKGEKS